MKKINFKVLLVTIVVTLSPIILGITFYNKLPEQIPIHFDFNNIPNDYAQKNFALFGIPTILALLQMLCCLSSDLTKKDNQENEPKAISIMKWFIPVLSIVISTIMIGTALGNHIDVRKVVCILLGIIFILSGNYMPKMSYESAKWKIHPLPKNEKKFRKMMIVLGYTFVILGILLLISILFKPIITGIVIAVFVVLVIFESLYYSICNE